MNLRVISDGTLEGTRVEHPDTGELVENVNEVRFVLDSGQVQYWAEVVIMCPITKLTLEADTTEFYKRVARELSLDQSGPIAPID